MKKHQTVIKINRLRGLLKIIPHTQAIDNNFLYSINGLCNKTVRAALALALG